MVNLIRQTVELTMSQTATITTPTVNYTQNNMGNPAYGETTTTTPCRLAPMQNTPRDSEVGGQLQAESGWRMRVPAETDIPDDATVTVDGQEFEVVAQRGPRSYETARSVILRKRTVT